MTPLAAGKVASGKIRRSLLECTRCYSNSSNGNGNGNGKFRAEDTEIQRDLFVNVLTANATRRDAKQYLDRFKPPKKAPPVERKVSIQDERNARCRRDQDRLDRMGVNLGGLYAPAQAIANAPQFTQQETKREQTSTVPEQQLHIALACLRAPEEIDDETLDGLAKTLSQLVKLDMRIALVLASNDPLDKSTKNGDPALDIRPIRNAFSRQASRICDAIDRHNPEGGRSVPNALEQNDDSEELEVAMPELIGDPLRRGAIPVIPAMAYTTLGKLVPVSSSEVMLGLTKFLSKLDNTSTEVTSLDRIIILDAVGGIPSKERNDGAHVFINLKQEFDQIKNELRDYASQTSSTPTIYDQHLTNMSMVQRCLQHLPSSSSALIVTPHEAASSSRTTKTPQPLGTGTRRQKNPLIHNLLTNKPLVSSSLPTARFASPHLTTNPRTQLSTVLRLGMPLSIIPTPSSPSGWQRPANGTTPLRLDASPKISFPRLIALIEDSFRRRLDVEHYLSRIHPRIAGLIIAGSYAGCAILTWEMPPHTTDPSRLVPYLDKFAVASSEQGGSGVADILFQAMVRTGFPEGVCWRSRRDNPVNRWYFERSEGMWAIPGTEWVMFWTGRGVVEDEQRWEDYVAVCRSVPASLEKVKK